MFIKIKPQEELEKNHFIKVGAIWINEQEYIERYETPDEKITRYFRVIDYTPDEIDNFGENYFGKVITNNEDYTYSNNTNTDIIYVNDESDKDFSWIYGWAGEEITPESHPEYFI
jgi:hypothetical protein